MLLERMNPTKDGRDTCRITVFRKKPLTAPQTKTVNRAHDNYGTVTRFQVGFYLIEIGPQLCEKHHKQSHFRPASSRAHTPAFNGVPTVC